MIDFPTAYSLRFVSEHLPPSCRRILEVGCGDGRLARALLDRGLAVVGIDTDADAVAAARARGVDAHRVGWPHAEMAGFDAVLFTRSLHHIQPLQEAIDRAWEALAPQGRVIIEDFRYREVEPATVEWFAGTLRLLEAAGALDDRHGWLRRLAVAEDPMQVWHAEHDHGLSSFDEIELATRARFDDVSRVDAAYCFRYVADGIADDTRREGLTAAVARLEERLSGSNAIRALGQRLVARRRDSKT